ncbi:MAG: ribosomal-processing cysteine protease Prp [Oscillospiraceae bacterium]|jgi:uncharacterized protein YsxB (DUF464 family)|nr:ribosomal-processing cysteine protease Prp [Oscillospiraceae bacterium]
MTQVTYWVSPRGRIKGYTALGHADWAVTGEDIVCAGVSALTQCTVNALEGVAKLKPRVLRRPGFLLVQVAETSGIRWHDAQVILKACANGVASLARQYPDHVRVLWKIVK